MFETFLGKVDILKKYSNWRDILSEIDANNWRDMSTEEDAGFMKKKRMIIEAVSGGD
jgi:hypothetical protein